MCYEALLWVSVRCSGESCEGKDVVVELSLGERMCLGVGFKAEGCGYPVLGYAAGHTRGACRMGDICGWVARLVLASSRGRGRGIRGYM